MIIKNENFIIKIIIKNLSIYILFSIAFSLYELSITTGCCIFIFLKSITNVSRNIINKMLNIHSLAVLTKCSSKPY